MYGRRLARDVLVLISGDRPSSDNRLQSVSGRVLFRCGGGQTRQRITPGSNKSLSVMYTSIVRVVPKIQWIVTDVGSPFGLRHLWKFAIFQTKGGSICDYKLCMRQLVILTCRGTWGFVGGTQVAGGITHRATNVPGTTVVNSPRIDSYILDPSKPPESTTTTPTLRLLLRLLRLRRKRRKGREDRGRSRTRVQLRTPGEIYSHAGPLSHCLVTTRTLDAIRALPSGPGRTLIGNSVCFRVYLRDDRVSDN